MANKHFEARYERGVNKIDIGLNLLLWQDEEMHYVYAPTLDITGYGISDLAATESFEFNLQQFIDYTANKKTLFDELEKLGWTVNKKKGRIHAPEEKDLLEDNETYREVLNRPGVSTKTKQVAMAL
ncbi:hypothetical protein [Arcticibacter eurypsychrophilus]|uniref:hypothetical protein n=1 Tax=Arcticibacter eurypsychrophilus TaxID=1434752 RepID=UPI00084D4AE4|nr:hypothetical protein [Arcticibacter eurypsychrophilus]